MSHYLKQLDEVSKAVTVAHSAATKALNVAPNEVAREAVRAILVALHDISDDERGEASSGLVCEAWEAAPDDESSAEGR